MAEQITVKQLMAQWAKGEFHPVYLFAGGDLLQKEEAVKTLEKHFLAGDASGLSVDRFDGETTHAGAVLSAARTRALLGERRLVLVRRAQALSAADTNALADGVSALNGGGNCLVLLWDEKADARHALVQTVRSVGAVVTFWVPFENKLPLWVQERVAQEGKTIRREAAEALLESVGPNTQDLAQEIEKLLLYVKDRSVIEAADVDAFRPDSHTLQYLELDRALWRKDFVHALKILQMLVQQGESPAALLPQLVRAYRRLLVGKTLLSEKKVSREEMWDELWIRMYEPQQEFLQAVSRYSFDQLLKTMERLLRAEHALKTGRMNPDTGISLLVKTLTEEVTRV